MDFKVVLLLFAIPIAGLGLVILIRRRRAAKPSAAVSEWDTWSSLLDVGIGFCDHNLVLRRANPAFLSMFVHARGGSEAILWQGPMTVAQWLSDGEAVHPLETLLMRSLSGKGEVTGRVEINGGERCVVRIQRIMRDGLPFFNIVAESIRTRNDLAGTAVMAAAQDTVAAQSAHDRMRDEEIMRISHDLRNPLNAMAGWLHLLETEMIPQEEVIPTVRRIQRSLLRQNGVIDELRKLANADHAIAQRALLNYPAASNRRH